MLFMVHPKSLTRSLTFFPWLQAAWKKNDSRLCVGLDPVLDWMPACYSDRSDAFLAFCCGIIDATSSYACAFKPQIACFSRERAEDQLEEIISYIHRNYPWIPVILDAKRADIGLTAEHYAQEAFARYDADAVTVNPYMGEDAIYPYLEWEDRGVFVLCRTSNPSASEIQSLVLDSGMPLFEWVALWAREHWNSNGQVGLVVGATALKELARVRALVGSMPILVPGVGVQGGVLEDVLEISGNNTLVNLSRSILYASSGEDCMHAAALVARDASDASAKVLSISNRI